MREATQTDLKAMIFILVSTIVLALILAIIEGG